MHWSILELAELAEQMLKKWAKDLTLLFGCNWIAIGGPFPSRAAAKAGRIF